MMSIGGEGQVLDNDDDDDDVYHIATVHFCPTCPRNFYHNFAAESSTTKFC